MSIHDLAKAAMLEAVAEKAQNDADKGKELIPLAREEFYKVFGKYPDRIEANHPPGRYAPDLAVDAYADGLRIRMYPSKQLVKYCSKCQKESAFSFRTLVELGELLGKRRRCSHQKGFIVPRPCGGLFE